MKTFKQHLEEAYSGSLWHSTTLESAYHIVNSNFKFEFSSLKDEIEYSSGSIMKHGIDPNEHRGKYFLSTARSLHGKYTEYVDDGETNAIVSFELDGRLLSQRFKIRPVSWNSPLSDQHPRIASEEEERVWSNKEVNDLDFAIKSVRFYKTVPDEVNNIKYVIAALRDMNVPYKVYELDDYKPFKSQLDKNKLRAKRIMGKRGDFDLGNDL